MLFAYYIGFAVLLAVAGPFLLLKKKARALAFSAGLWQKFGFIPWHSRPRSLKDARGLKSWRSQPGGIWFHSVSVGEFNAVRPLIEKIKEARQDIPIYVSTTTATGQTLAKEKVGSFATIFYFPFDLPFATRNWIRFLKPSLVAVVETELWPGFVDQCNKAGVPVTIVNGRMSPKSFQSYYRLRFFFGEALRKLSCLCVQSESERSRYLQVGGEKLPILVTGNMKLDGLVTISDTAVDELRRRINVLHDDFVVVAGSTHEGEELAVIEAHRLLQRQWSEAQAACFKNKTASGDNLAFDDTVRGNNSLSGNSSTSSNSSTSGNNSASGPKPFASPRLIIAPRHPERFERVTELVESQGFVAKRFSKNERFAEDDDIYILDGLGQLAKFYSLATVAFVGGTLAPIGGHNLLEPYAYAVPTCCGPHTHKTRDIANVLNELEALVQAKSSEELRDRICRFHQDPQPARELGERGKRWIKENQGAVKRTYEAIIELFDTRSLSEKFLNQGLCVGTEYGIDPGSAGCQPALEPGVASTSRQAGGAPGLFRQASSRGTSSSRASGTRSDGETSSKEGTRDDSRASSTADTKDGGASSSSLGTRYSTESRFVGRQDRLSIPK